jgi:hypothetical protein
MNLKIFGILILVLSGILFAITIKKNNERKILALIEFIKNLDSIYNYISLYKMNVNEIIKKLSGKADSILKDFYLEMLSSDEELDKVFLRLTDKYSFFNERSTEFIYDFFASFGKVPYDTQLSQIEGTSLLLKEELKSFKENSDRTLKAKCSLALSITLMLAIILM